VISLERSQPEPASIRREQHYDTVEVRERLFRDARGKCYLCEQPVELGDFEIDHRKPKAPGQFPELRLSWRNLYCCCHKCNQLRPRLWPDGGLLSPDESADAVEHRLSQWLDDETHPCFRPASSGDEAASNTAEELRKVHGTQDTLRAHDMRKALSLQLNRVFTVRHQLLLLRHDPEARARKREELRRLVSRSAPFTALIRSRFMHDPLVVRLFD